MVHQQTARQSGCQPLLLFFAFYLAHKKKSMQQQESKDDNDNAPLISKQDNTSNTVSASNQTDTAQRDPIASLNISQSSKTWLKAFIVYFIVACDALCFTIIQPFLSEMVVNRFGVSDKSQIGIIVGVILSAFPAARFCSSSYLGYFSDLYGRKRFLMFSLFVNFIGTLVFGLVDMFWLAALLRFLQGLLRFAFIVFRRPNTLRN